VYDLTDFTLRDMTDCGAALRKLGAGAHCLEEVAGRIVCYFYEHLGDGTGARACALTRFFTTLAYRDLDADLQAFARRLLRGHDATPALKCLVLLASAGDRPEWNDRQASVGHRAIPLPSVEMLTQLPMISQLVTQLGLKADHLLHPDPGLLVDAEHKTYSVFHVAEAQGSPYVPVQDEFVVPYRIRSVLGFGGLLASGHLFAVIVFAKAPVSRETAELFKPLALSVKLAVLPFAGGAIFAS